MADRLVCVQKGRNQAIGKSQFPIPFQKRLMDGRFWMLMNYASGTRGMVASVRLTTRPLSTLRARDIRLAQCQPRLFQTQSLHAVTLRQGVSIATTSQSMDKKQSVRNGDRIDPLLAGGQPEAGAIVRPVDGVVGLFEGMKNSGLSVLADAHFLILGLETDIDRLIACIHLADT